MGAGPTQPRIPRADAVKDSTAHFIWGMVPLRSFGVSAAQESLWLAQKLTPDVPNNVGSRWLIDGPVDEETLFAALRAVHREYAAAQVNFRQVDEELRQVVREDAAATWRPLALDVSAEADPEAAARALSAEIEWRPFDLEHDELFRAGVIKLSESRRVLFLTAHHLVMDGYTGFRLLPRRVAECYTALAAGTPVRESVVSGPDLIREEDVRYRNSPQFERDSRFWRDYLTQAPAPLRLRGKSGASVPSVTHYCATVPRAEADAWLETADADRVPLAALLTAAAGVCFRNLGGHQEFTISTSASGRTSATRDTFGSQTSVVPLRMDVPLSSTFRELTGAMLEEMKEVHRHGARQLADIRRELRLDEAAVGPGSAVSRCGATVNVASFIQELTFAGTKAHLLPGSPVGAVDDLHIALHFDGRPTSDLYLRIDANGTLYSTDDLRRLWTHLVAFLRAVLAEPDMPVGRIDVLTPEQRQLVLHDVQDTVVPRAELTIPGLFARQAARTPDAVAVLCGPESLTYRELDARATRLARELVARGAGPETLVGLALPHSTRLVVGMLGILKSGAGLLPVGPACSSGRLEQILFQARPLLLLTDADTVDALPTTDVPCLYADELDLDGPGDPEPVAVPLRPDHIAYVLYTSKSTGVPKGATMTHAAAVNGITRMTEAAGMHAGTCILVGTSVDFDVPVFEILTTLGAGGTLLVARDALDKGEHAEPAATALSAVPSVSEELADRLAGAEDVETVALADGPLPVPLIRRLREALPDARIVNGYRSIEGAFVTVNSMEAEADWVATGGTRPLGNVRTYVLGPGLMPVPPGVVGELYIGGLIGRGYYSLGALTAERFVADPYGAPGARMYRSGDLARWNDDGLLEQVGRDDTQIKVRGFRVEPGEVEAALTAHPGVAEAAVVAREVVGRSGRQLVAYVVPGLEPGADGAGGGLDTAALREYAARHLPEYMVPSTVVALAQLPLAPNGKFDHKALPEPDSGGAAYRAPHTPAEDMLCGLFAEVLYLDRIGVDDNFFTLGGHSLLATRLVGRIRTTLDAEITIRTVYAAPTVAELAASLPDPDLPRSHPRLPSADEQSATVPLSFAQRRMWFIDRFEGPSALYNAPIPLRLSGALDAAALERAIGDVVARHESLRTLIGEDGAGVPFQQVLPVACAPVELPVVEVPADAVIDVLERAGTRPFDLTAELPVRATLFRCGPEEHVLLLLIHHIASDGLSQAPLSRDLATAYAARLAGRSPDWAELPIQYADYTLWQHELLGDEDDPNSLQSAQVDYWRKELTGVPQPLVLPTDRPRAPRAGHRGADVEFALDPDVMAAVEDLASAHGATPAMVLQAALAVLLHGLGGGDDLTIGSPIAGRTDEQLADLVGFFVNTWVLRADLSGHPTFTELLKQTRDKALAAYDHQDVPFERLVEALNPERSTAYSPLFQVMFAWQTFNLTGFALSGLDVRFEWPPVTTAKFDLFFNLIDLPGLGAIGHLEYATDLFDADTARALAGRYTRLVRLLCTDPSRRAGSVELLDAHEQELVIGRFNDTAAPVPDLTVPALFERRAAQCPQSVAVVSGDTSYTYRELDAAADRLARELVRRGVGPETLVGLALPRSAELVVGLLGILKAGGAYLPVDPRYPSARLDFVLADARPHLLLTNAEAAAVLPDSGVPRLFLDDVPDDADGMPTPVSATLRPDNVAYVMYTSGSTGTPKGAAVTHATVVNGVMRLAAAVGVHERTRMLAGTSVNFDVSVFEILTTLFAGGTLDVVRDVLRLGGGGGWRGGVISTVPSVFAELLDEIAATTSVETLVFAGEALPAALVRRARAAFPGVRVVNAYGQTESFYATLFTADGATDTGGMPLGGPIGNMRAYVLGSGLASVPVGVVGELYVAGHIARGYHHHPGLTAERFVADPYGLPGSRMYRTGDLARWTPEGHLEYAGRTDTQVKMRGFRIEPGEVEVALTAHPQVAQAVVVVRDTAGSKQLVGYVVPSSRTVREDSVDLLAGIGAQELRAAVARRLPDFMVPSAFVVLDRLPLTPNGKVDRTALPEPKVTGRTYRAPRTAHEKALAAVFAEVLGLERVGLDDDFFASGGDSIRSLQVVSRARARDVEITPKLIFEWRTVAALAEAATTITTADGSGGADEDAGDDSVVPLLPIARHLLDAGGGYERFAMAMAVELPEGIDEAGLHATLAAVCAHHPVLRARLATAGEDFARHGDGEHQPVLLVEDPAALEVAALVRRTAWEAPGVAAAWEELVAAELESAAGRLDPRGGVMAQFVWFDPMLAERATAPGTRGRLLIVLHHMVVDGVSWRILLPDLAAAWAQVRDDRIPRLPGAGTAPGRWARALTRDAHSAERLAELPLWRSVLDGPDPLLGARDLDPEADTRTTLEHLRIGLSAEATEKLLTALPAAYGGGVNDGLLTALSMAVARWRRDRGVDASTTLVKLEGHGREETVVPGADLSRTLGWFTTVFPVRLDVAGHDLDNAFAGGPAAGALVKDVKERLRALPDKGLGYGLLRHLNPEAGAELDRYSAGQIGFNYLGRFGATDMPEDLRGLGFTPVGDLTAPRTMDIPAMSTLEINAAVLDSGAGACLETDFAYPPGVLGRAEVSELAGLWRTALEALALHAAGPDAGGLTPSDLPLVAATQADIDGWERRYPGLVDVWPLTALQSGLLFHTELSGDAWDPYQMQLTFQVSGHVDAERLRAAGQALLDRHASLRAAFTTDTAGNRVQVITPAGVGLPWRELDLRALPDQERDEAVAAFLADDHAEAFTPETPPLLRLSLVRTGELRADVVLTVSHVLLDGWSLPLLMRELLFLYGSGGDPSVLPRLRPFRDFLRWLDRQDKDATARAWAAELDGVREPTLLLPDAVSGRGDRHAVGSTGIGQAEVGLSPDEARELSRQAAELGVTVNTLVQGAWAVLLGQLTGRQEVVFGATVSGRPPQVPGSEAMLGMFINTLPVRVHCTPGAPLAQVLTTLQERQAALLDHHHQGLTELHQTLGLPTLFDTLVVFQSYPVDRAGIVEAHTAAGIEVTGIRPVTGTHYPLTVMAESSPHLRLSLHYQHALFDPSAAHTVAERFLRVLRRIADDPRQPVASADILGPDERALLIGTSMGAATLAPVPETTVADLFERQAAATPDAVAVVCDGASATYAEIDARADHLARELTSRGAGPETVVAVSLPRTPDLIVALLAVFKAGAAYLPIDPKYPGDRLDLILSDAAPALLLTDTATADVLPATDAPVLLLDTVDLAELPATGLADRVRPGPAALAYVMYTSGSTGTPKGVLLDHATVVNGIRHLADHTGITAGSRVLAAASVNFDVSVFETFTTLCHGGILDLAQDVLELAERDTWHGSVISTVPSAFAELIDRITDKTSVETLVFAGEALPAALVRRTREAFPNVRIVNAYGQTESFYATTFTTDGTGRSSTAIGTPLPNMRTYVLGPGLTPAPKDVVGELYVAGQLARGYHHRPGLTAERFVADPYGPPGSRMYRTGDLARWNDSGHLEYAGRSDTQVKVRGFRIEPAEVEAALTAHPDVGQAAVIARDSGGTAGVRLLAYVVLAGTVDVTALRAFSAARLPEFMVPSAFVVLDQLPLAPNGKLDHKALPEPRLDGEAYRAPRTSRERVLADLFAQVLGVDRVGVDDNFFTLGGHSLLATRLTGRIRTELGVELPIRAVFDAPTVAELARELATDLDVRTPLRRRSNRPSQVPLSYAQRRLWFIDRFEGPSATYNIPLTLCLTGDLDVAALTAALGDVVARHESLRTLIAEDGDGNPHQVVLPVVESRPDVPVVTVGAAEVAAAVDEAARQPFDLAADIPLRARLLRRDATDHLLCLVLHHIAGDGQSMAPLLREFAAAYAARLAGRAPQLPPLPVQYTDYTLWQHDLLGDADDPHSALARQCAYWKAELADVPQPLRLPTDRLRPAVASHRGDQLDFTLDAELLDAVERLAREREATTPMVMQAALAVLLHQLGAGDDIPIGSPIAGRTDAALDGLIGFFVNTWVLRADLSGHPTFADLLDRVRNEALSAYDHQDVPFERLVELLNPERSTAHHALFQVMLAWQNIDQAGLGLPGLRVTPVPANTGTAKFDLFFNMAPDPSGGAYGQLEYATDLFDHATAEGLVDRFVRVLRQVVTDPGTQLGAVDVLTSGERDWLTQLNETTVPVPGATVPELVAAQAARTPDAVAVVSGQTTLSYGELEARADRLALVLRERGTGPDVLVAVALPRSADLAVALLAVLKAGGAYLPIDPNHPAARMDLLLNTADPALVLTDGETAATLPECRVPVLHLDDLDLEGPPVQAPVTGVRPDNLAYVMYTSGSTGVPKGVAITHASVVNGVRDLGRIAHVESGSRMLAATSVNFDVSVFEIFTALTSGATVEIVRDVLELGERGSWSGATISAVPAVFSALLDEIGTDGQGSLELDVETVVFAGEALSADLVDRVCDTLPGVRVVNAYGQTESFYASTMTLPRNSAGTGATPIGRPLANMRAYVLGPELTPVATGVVGELYVAGLVARGYYGSGGATAERFVACPFGPVGARMYRTGDLAQWDRNGQLKYEGRADTQVKVNGIRVEPTEIEAVLAGHPAVSQAAVRVWADHNGNRRLAGYVVPMGSSTGVGDFALDASVSVADLRRFVAGRLPDYMVPAQLVVLDRLPLTPSGKLDRAALPEPEFAGGEYRAPRSEAERVLAEVYADVLDAQRVGIDDDFFASGGDSIRSIQVVARTKARGVVVSAREVFEQRTVARLAELVGGRAEEERATLAELPDGGVGWAPLPPTAAHVLGLGGGIGRFCMSAMLTLPGDIDRAGLVATLQAVLDRHDVLRSRLDRKRPGLRTGPVGSVDAGALVREAPHADADVQAELDAAAGRLDPDAGVMAQFVWFTSGTDAGRLLVVLHHLVVDGVSWRILVPDLVSAWQRVRAGGDPERAGVGTSSRRWVHALAEEAAAPERVAELPVWQQILAGDEPTLGARELDRARDVAATVDTVRVQVPADVTETVLNQLPAVFRGGADGGLLAGLALALARWRRTRGLLAGPSTLVRLEGHGREEHLVPGADLSGTVGWFTAMYPVRLDLTGIDVADAFAGGPAAGRAIKAVKEQLRAVPDAGMGYGLLRHLNPDTAAALAGQREPQIGFNYLGRTSGADIPEELRGLGWGPDTTHRDLVAAPDGDMPVLSALEINAVATNARSGDELTAYFAFPTGVLSRDEVTELAELWVQALTALARHATTPDAGGLTPTDAPLVDVRQEEIETWEAQLGKLAAVWPAIPAQSGLLFQSMLAGAQFDAYHMQLVFHLSGAVDPERMRRAGQALLDRYPSLRAAFVNRADGDVVQVIPEAATLPWQHLDLTAADETERTETFERLLVQDRTTHFEVDTPPLIRLALAVLEPDRAELVLTAHHVLFDGWSTPLLMRDLLLLYASNGDPADLPAIPDYGDFLSWLTRQDHQESARVWAAELDGVQEPTLLMPNTGTQHDSAGIGNLEVAFEDKHGLSRLAARLGVTLNTLVQGAWAVLLANLTGQSDILFGATVSGRPPTVKDVDDMVGLFINTVPVRVHCERQETFADLLTDLQARQAPLLDHHHHSLAEIQQAAGLSTLFDTLVVFESFPVDREAIGEANSSAGVAITGLRPLAGTHYPVILAAGTDPQLQMALQYQQDVLDHDAAADIADRFVRVLRQVVADPSVPVGAIEVLAEDERDWLVRRVNDTAHPMAAGTLPETFEAQVERTPDAVAVTADDETLTYGEFNRRANQLAHWLVEQGAGPEQLVAVRIPRSVDLLVAIYAVVKAGAAYVPVDIDLPEERVQHVLNGAKPLLMLDEALPDVSGYSETNPERVLSPDNAAYVIFTSGSTGGPKGVQVSHRSIMNRIRWGLEHFDVTVEDRMLVSTSASFDVSVPELFAPLQVGAAVVVARPDGRRDPAYLGELIRRERVTGADFVPSLLEAFVAEPSAQECTSLRWIEVAGEVFPATLANKVSNLLPDCGVHNLYGPTEASVEVTGWQHVPGADRVPIGAPIWNAQVYVLDSALRPVAPGVAGELYLAGVGLARGYLGQAALTSERFVACPFGEPGARMYRSGDVVRWNKEGQVEYIGRTDDQVKIRGFRIELGEIEHALNGHPGVAQAVTVVREDQKGDKRLVAYVVPDPGAAAATDAGAQVDEWRDVYDDTYADSGDGVWGEDFQGWNSSYTGEPIPLEQMREWRDAAVAQVLRFGPRRVLEIGVGSGLLLAKIVGEVEEYWGTDISATVVDRVRAQAEQAGHGDRVHLSAQAAHDKSGLPQGGFDSVVLNSVVQYFPSADYLDQVLCQAMDLLAPGGRVIVGDVRNASTLRLLQTAVQRAAHPRASREEVRALVEQALLAERELVVAPEWFVEWVADRPVGVDVRLKPGQAHNELTRHRYEVILHKQPTDMFDLTRVPTVPWGREVSDLAGLGGCVDRADDGPVRVTGIPNARLAQEASAGVLRADTPLGEPVDPDDLAAWARQQGRDAVITWSGETAHNFDAVLLPEQGTGQRPVSGGFVPSAAVARTTRANNPALAKTVGPLLAELRQHLRAHLPDYMVPAMVVPLSELPLNTAGKVDRRALPSKHTTTVSKRGPRNSHEEKLCALFSELLGLERVGIDDSFFELGGHSLLATRLSARILKQFGVDIPLRAITEHPTVADLAALGLVGGTPDDRADSFAVVLPLNRDPGTGKPPVWFFHGGGGLGWPYFTFAPHLDRPAYALQSRGSNGKDPVAGSVQEMIDDYLTQILRTQPGGPYYLIGWSFGGPVAHAVAEALDRRGHEVALLAVLDTQPATPDPESGFKQVAGKTAAEYRAAVEDVLREAMSTDNLDSFLENMSNVGANNLNRMATFESPVYRGDLLYFNATLDKTEETTSYGPGWRPYVLGSLEEYDVEATHHDLHMPKPAGQIMKVITRKLAEE